MMFLSKGANFIFQRKVISHLQREAISTTKENNSCSHSKGDNFIERTPYFEKHDTQQDLMHDPNMHTGTGLQELKTVSESFFRTFLLFPICFQRYGAKSLPRLSLNRCHGPRKYS